MKFKLVKKEPVAKNIITFWWQPAQPVRNIAGQYTELYLPHEKTDSRGNKRWFTLSNSPTEELLSITTKFNTQRSSTFKTALKNLKEGAQIDGHLPMGDFVLPKDKSIPLLFIAGGIGVTPYRSIIKSLIDSGEKRDITLIYAVANEDELAFEDILRQGTAEFIKHVGRLTADDILGYDDDIKNRIVYISGPEPMAEALENDLKAKGLDSSKIRTDFFPNYDKF